MYSRLTINFLNHFKCFCGIKTGFPAKNKSLHVVQLFSLFTGCPFICSVSDTSRVSVNLSSLELIPVNQVARFHVTVDNSASAELSVSVTGNLRSLLMLKFRPTRFLENLKKKINEKFKIFVKMFA